MRRFSVAVLSLAVAALLVSATLVSAAGRGPVVTVGSEKVEEAELIRLIVDQTGADESMTPFVLAQLPLEDRETFAQQVVTALLLSEAARTKGIDLDPAVASQLRWNAVNILAQAYISSISAKWDLGRPVLEKWFASHQQKYYEPEAVHVRHILVSTEAEAMNVLLEVYGKDADFATAAVKYSQDPGSAQKGGDLGWVSRGMTVEEFDRLAFSLAPGRIGGPVETRFGWHIVQVIEKKAARMPSLDEVLPRVREDVQQNYLALEIERLGKSLGVDINQEILSTLGGFPAFSRTQ
ncbi:MAG: peptidylprolyl isomerase [Thermovirga sp.]